MTDQNSDNSLDDFESYVKYKEKPRYGYKIECSPLKFKSNDLMSPAKINMRMTAQGMLKNSQNPTRIM